MRPCSHRFTIPATCCENGVKIGTKAWDVFEACLNIPLAEDEQLDTDDLVGKKFEAMVSVKKTGKGNRTEHGTLGPHRPQQARVVEKSDAEQPEDTDDDFSDLPF